MDEQSGSGFENSVNVSKRSEITEAHKEVHKFTFMNNTSGNYFSVHKAGCRDIQKHFVNGKWDVEAETIDAALEAQIKDMADGSGGDLQFHKEDFTVYPCTKEG